MRIIRWGSAALTALLVTGCRFNVKADVGDVTVDFESPGGGGAAGRAGASGAGGTSGAGGAAGHDGGAGGNAGTDAGTGGQGLPDASEAGGDAPGPEAAVCSPGYFGPSCQPCPSCGNGTCNDGYTGTGACICNPGWEGASCMDCAAGYWGIACQACSCVHGTCHQGLSGDGQCTCESGWTGTDCDTASPVDAGSDAASPVDAEPDATDGATAHGTPFGGTPLTFGSSTTTTVEAENYDVGGEGISYHDTTLGNSGGQYRTDDVDIDHGCGTSCLAITAIAPGEWTEYTISVASAGDFSIQLGVSSPASRQMHIEVDGANVSGPITVNPSTDAGVHFVGQTVSGLLIHVNSGVHVMRWVFDDGTISINWIKFTRTAG